VLKWKSATARRKIGRRRKKGGGKERERERERARERIRYLSNEDLLSPAASQLRSLALH
jgi:hypothetical protein